MRSKKIIAVVLTAVVLVIGFAVSIVALTNKHAVGVENALSLAISDANCDENTVSGYSAKVAFQEGMIVYKVDFSYDGFTYEYVISSLTDKIISKDRRPISFVLPSESESVTTEQNSNDNTTAEYTQPVTPTTVTDVTSTEAPIVTESREETTVDVTTANQQGYPNGTYIGIDRAKEIALAYVNVDASRVIFTKAKLDKEHGIRVYKIEFETATNEYEFEIHAVNGDVLEYSEEAVDDD